MDVLVCEFFCLDECLRENWEWEGGLKFRVWI